MRIGISTSVVLRGKTGVAQYVFALLRALSAYTKQHEFTLFISAEDLPLFDFLKGPMNQIVVPEKFRPPVKTILWHQAQLPNPVRQHGTAKQM